MRELDKVGVGLTVIVKLCDGPVHDTLLFVNVGVTVIVAIIGDVPALTAANDDMLPVPLAASPIPGVSFVHEYVVVPTVRFVLKLTAAVLPPLHTV